MTESAAWHCPPARYDKLLALPETVVGEILDGELVASPRPAPRHGRAVARLHGMLAPAYDQGTDGPGGWWLFLEPEIHLNGNVVVPDLAGWRQSNLADLPEDGPFHSAPDWVCEVLSPTSVRRDRVTKLNLYGRFAVPFYWIIDPIERTLEAFRRDGERWVVEASLSGDDPVAIAPFPDRRFRLSDLWGKPAG